MKANEKDDCGHSCFDAECQGDADPMCLVHGMTPDEAYEAARKAAEGATVAAGGWCAPSVMPPAEAREEWKARTFHEHYGLSGRDGGMSVVVCPPNGDPGGHWEWRMDPPDNATRQLGQWTWVED